MTDIPEELVELARKVVAHFASDTRDGNAPGHGHRIPGIWDDCNVPELAGKPCQWCADWNAFCEALQAKEWVEIPRLDRP